MCSVKKVSVQLFEKILHVKELPSQEGFIEDFGTKWYSVELENVKRTSNILCGS